MKKLYIILSSLIIAFLFSGCCQPCIQPTFPTMEMKSPTNLSWEDVQYNGAKVHMLNSYEWDYVQSELIDAGIKANMCIDLVNKYNTKKAK